MELKEKIHIKNVPINDDTVNSIDARELCEFLEMKERFNHWIKRRIEKYEFKEGEDFIKYSISNNMAISGCQQRIEYSISIEMAKALCLIERSKKGFKGYRQLKKLKPQELYIIEPKTKEYRFGEDIVKKLFDGYKIHSQYVVESTEYRLDWYIPELNIAIEHDDVYHNTKSQIDADKKRQKEVENILRCRFLRYKVYEE